MSPDTQRDQLSKKRVVYTVPGMEAVPVRRDEPYRVTDAGPLTMDLYYPPDSKAGARTPAVIFVTGFSDLGAEKMLGSKFKDMGSFVSWAQLVAISGFVGITYANSEPGDVYEVLHHVQQNAASLGIDGLLWTWAERVVTADGTRSRGSYVRGSRLYVHNRPRRVHTHHRCGETIPFRHSGRR